MKIALLGGTGETGVEVVLDQNKNKHDKIFSGDETSLATGLPGYPWGENLYLRIIWGAFLFLAC